VARGEAGRRDPEPADAEVGSPSGRTHGLVGLDAALDRDRVAQAAAPQRRRLDAVVIEALDAVVAALRTDTEREVVQAGAEQHGAAVERLRDDLLLAERVADDQLDRPAA